ncbi:hypothetical protein CHISP_1452 [Chitinispirillum alkaliphilum]|nr:hypothetical protein CHISP_1452 [Chitinispirillum alkaliphilum]
MKNKQLKKSLTLLRLIMIVVPFVWIYKQTDPHSVKKIVETIDPRMILLIVMTGVSVMMIQGVKWWFLMRRFIPQLHLLYTLKVHLTSSFYSMVLPTSAAHDVLRAVILSKNHSAKVIWASSWLARLTGIIVLMVLSVSGALLLSSHDLPSNFRTTLFTILAMVSFLGVASFSKTVTRPFSKVIRKLPFEKITAESKKLRDAIYDYRNAYSTIIGAVLLSALVHMLIILNATFIIYAITGDFYLVQCIAFIPLIEILSISIPLTPGGIGIREALSALMFAQLGLSADQLGTYVIFSLMLSLLRIVGVLPILFDFFKRKMHRTQLLSE